MSVPGCTRTNAMPSAAARAGMSASPQYGNRTPPASVSLFPKAISTAPSPPSGAEQSRTVAEAGKPASQRCASVGSTSRQRHGSGAHSTNSASVATPITTVRRDGSRRTRDARPSPASTLTPISTAPPNRAIPRKTGAARCSQIATGARDAIVAAVTIARATPAAARSCARPLVKATRVPQAASPSATNPGVSCSSTIAGSAPASPITWTERSPHQG